MVYFHLNFGHYSSLLDYYHKKQDKELLQELAVYHTIFFLDIDSPPLSKKSIYLSIYLNYNIVCNRFLRLLSGINKKDRIEHPTCYHHSSFFNNTVPINTSTPTTSGGI